MSRVADRPPLVVSRARGTPLPDGLPPLPPAALPRRRVWPGPAMVAAIPLLSMLVALMAGGGPRAESADDAVITMAARDALGGHVLIGPYSRFGWHHPGPTYFYLLSIPTWIAHGGPTGAWVGATLIGIASVTATVWVVHRWAGRRVAWWAAVGILAVVAGLGPGLFRDPWNPYVVTLPVLFVAVACGFAAAGARGALVWAAVVGSFAVQTHVSTVPVVGGLLCGAGAVSVGRWWHRRRLPDRFAHIPAELPSLDATWAPIPWWRYRPEVAVGVMALVAEWMGPLWDQAFGTGNLGRLVGFFTTPHPGRSWDQSWRLVTAMSGVAMFQHHRALRDGVADTHPLLTTGAFLALVAVAVVAGACRRRPAAVWLGLFGLAGGALALAAVTRIVGEPYRYLLVWITVLPVVPLVAVAMALDGVRPAGAPGTPRSVSPGGPGGRARSAFPPAWARSAFPRGPGGRARSTSPPAWARPGAAVTAVAVVLASALALRGVARATPAAALTDRDVAAAWRLAAPIVGGGHEPVKVDIADNQRWPAAAGIALELERHGHPARVSPMWTFLFGRSRRATGNEQVTLVVAGSDSRLWPAPATLLGQAGPDVVFALRSGRACWWGWLPFGGPACPPAVEPSGPAVPLPIGAPRPAVPTP